MPVIWPQTLTLVETKSALDQLSRKLVSEFNEAHTFGVDLNGELGGEFFSLDGVKVEKQGTHAEHFTN